MSSIEQLMYLQGVGLEYHDYSGTLRRIPDATRRAVLKACGYNLEAESAIAKANFLLDSASWQQHLADTLFTAAGNPKLSVRVPASQQAIPVRWKLEAWDKEARAQPIDAGALDANLQTETGRYEIESTLYIERSWNISALPPGYYRLTVDIANKSTQSLLIASPDQTYNPIADQRIWGFSTQLYSLRSAQNYGVGDFTDLSQLISKAIDTGADFVLLNPLHALFPYQPERASPYSPSDRFLLNPIYISPDQCPEFSASPAVKKLTSSDAFKKNIRQLRQADWIDYSAVSQLKYGIFHAMFDHFVNHDLKSKSVRGAAFTSFCQTHAEALAAHTNWLTGTTNTTQPHQDPAPARFHHYLQWLARSQLEAVQEQAKTGGMKLGLVRDLAVGCVGDGSEAKRYAELFVPAASIGAPPDPLGPLGQNWGLPPQNPVQIKAGNYEHFIQLIRANMRDCGALRIDHVMGLLRLWWCVESDSDEPNRAPQGCYVYYPFEQLLAILKLESVLQRCAVVGEDLGIVPEQVKHAMADAQVFSNLLFYFEKDHQGKFRAPAHLNQRALLMIANHDVAPFGCWWQSEDLAMRQRLDLFAHEADFHQALAHRAEDKLALLQWLQENEGKSSDAETCTAPENLAPLALFKRIATALAASPVRLFALQLEDLDDEPAPVNLPGTDREYPNWRRRLKLPLDALLADKTFFTKIKKARLALC